MPTCSKLEIHLRFVFWQQYKIFHSRLTTTKYEILGIRVPIMRKIAHEISKSEISSFLESCQHNYYEEVMIEGFVLAAIKEKETILKYLDHYTYTITLFYFTYGFVKCKCIYLTF